jgi:hypothetical protein
MVFALALIIAVVVVLLAEPGRERLGKLLGRGTRPPTDRPTPPA